MSDHLRGWRVFDVCDCKMRDGPHVHMDEPVYEPWSFLVALGRSLELKVEKPIEDRPWLYLISHPKGWKSEGGTLSIAVHERSSLSDYETELLEKAIRALAAATGPS